MTCKPQVLSTEKNTYRVSISTKQPPITGDCSLFFQSEGFVNRDLPEGLPHACLYRDDTPIASIPFVIEDPEAISLPKCPFGSVSAVAEIKASEIALLLKELLSYLSKSKLHKFQVISFPRVYNEELYDKFDTAVNTIGFENKLIETGQYLDLNQSFIDQINPSERRYINNAAKKGYSFKKLGTAHLSEVYELIKTPRIRKGYPVTMSLSELESTFNRFPEHYLLFGLFEKDKIIAGSICIRVNQHILYDFYHGDDLAYRKHSPVVPLISEIHKYAQYHRYQTLDLGISTENGLLNEGLFKFKKSIGAYETSKPIYCFSL